jgi:hypothetical protein
MAKPKGNKKTKPEAPETANLPAVASSVALTTPVPEGFKAKRAVTLPSLSIKTGASYCLRLEDTLRVSKVKDKPTFESDGKTLKKPRDPATICTATDVVTGEQYIYLVNAVVVENLKRDYPDDTYIGKIFKIANMGKRNETQRYFDFSIIELEAA